MTPTRWLEVRVGLPPDPDQVARVTEGLLALGGRAVHEQDGVLLTHLPPPQGDEAAALAPALRELAGLPDLEVQTSWRAHEEWAETWRRGLAPRRITPRLVVAPSWERPTVGAEEVLLVLDPGMAFGNAEHGTTRGCLRLLDGVIAPGQRVLDVGAGSGVLAIAAARLGAGEVVAVEGDPLAWDTLEENVRCNGASGRVHLRREWAHADTLSDLGPCDGVLANLEAGILTDLLPGIAGAVRSGGWVILSGLLEADVGAIVRLCRSLGLRLQGEDADGEWRSLWMVRSAGESRGA